eukprot:7477336-Pyramimonas_sp.AAC.1
MGTTTSTAETPKAVQATNQTRHRSSDESTAGLRPTQDAGEAHGLDDPPVQAHAHDPAPAGLEDLCQPTCGVGGGHGVRAQDGSNDGKDKGKGKGKARAGR